MNKITYPIDLKDITFGKLTAICIDADNPKKWICQCECGNTKSISRNNLVTGHTTSCGCLAQKYPQDISGGKYGKLTVLRKDDDRRSHYICQCECGNIISADKNKLVTGHTRSCGCLNDKSAVMVGQKYGKLTVTGITDNRTRGYRECICNCDCGNTNVTIASSELRLHKTLTCGCGQDATLKKMHDALSTGAIDNTNIYQLAKKMPKNNKSGHKGVCWHKTKRRWTAYIQYKGKKYNLGMFKDIKDAVKIRIVAEQVTHEAFLEWYNKYKSDLDSAPDSPDDSELEALILKQE